MYGKNNRNSLKGGRRRKILTVFPITSSTLKSTRILSKYHNKKTEVDGYFFDSKKEATKYQELLLMQLDHGPDGVKSFTLQPRFELQPAFEKDGEKYRKIEYVADFSVIYNDGRREIIDVKGFSPAIFKLKAKLFDFRYPDLTLVIE